MDNSILELNEIHKSYSSVTALDGVNLKLEPGYIYALLGKKGAGKSTLVNILMRQTTPSSGSGSVLGYSLSDEHPEMRLDIDLIDPTRKYDFPGSIGKFLSFYSKYFPRWDDNIMNQTLSVFGISKDKDYLLLDLEDQTLFDLAVALAKQPKILLLDNMLSILFISQELQALLIDIHSNPGPLSEADENLTDMLLARETTPGEQARDYYIQALKTFAERGGTVLIVEDISMNVHSFVDRIILLDSGKIKLNSNLNTISPEDALVYFNLRNGK